MEANAATRPNPTAPIRHPTPWPTAPLGRHLHEWARRHGQRTALVDEQRRVSFAELDKRADSLAAGLAELGIGKGDCVLLQLPNGVAFAESLFALFRLGAVPLLAMPAQRIGDLDGLCALAQPKACIVPERFMGFDHYEMAQALRKRHPALRHLITDGEVGIPLSSLGGAARDWSEPAAGDIALLLQSGGTTGTPKLIPRTHADYGYNAQESARLCGLDQDSVYLAALPIAHNFPLACPGLIGTLAMGGRVVFAASPSSDVAFELIERERVTATALVPAMLPLWLQAHEWGMGDLSSLRLLQVGGARLGPELARRVHARLGCTLQQVFGMAEGLLCYTRPDDPEEVVLNTQGRPLSAADEIRIVGPDGRELPDGEAGELQTRGPYTIRGYYRAPAANAAAFTEDGFYRTGDLVRRRPDGNLVVEGRIKELINRAGEKISAAEIESHLRELPSIRDVALIAMADGTLGERSCACLLTDAPPSLRAVHDFLRGRGLPRHKLPDQLLRVAAWPLTAVGKIDKRKLAELAAEPQQDRYQEEALAIRHAPLALAAALARTLDGQTYTVYERGGEWSLGIGVAAEIVVRADAIELVRGESRQRWSTNAASFSAVLGEALASLDIAGWRLYGTAEFELSRHFAGLPLDRPDRPLMSLVVPETEIRLRQGLARLRTLRARALPAWIDSVAAADARDAEPDDGCPVAFDLSDDDPAYRRAVATAVEQIRARAYHKVILSRELTVSTPLDLVSTYLSGRNGNQPARSFLLSRPGFACTGFSPETVVEVSADGLVSTQPLAGTRSRGRDADEQARLRTELYHDPKEIAEHASSVKLAADEMARICRVGSIVVREFMNVSLRGSVQHLASRVAGQLAYGCDGWSAFQSLFPAVTASGIPKREAIEAIAALEGRPRGLYSGCVLIADCDGMLDAALVLRSVYRDGQRAWIQAGAGIVEMSTPERELEETREKLASVSHFLIAGGRQP
ncbi:salicylate synthase [Chromobacterium vaccinii]|uniref:salicylate synthase n=1 Tax=Chromobacterium vaccinii TaxID=1108595 RepID=UPI003C7123E9